MWCANCIINFVFHFFNTRGICANSFKKKLKIENLKKIKNYKEKKQMRNLAHIFFKNKFFNKKKLENIFHRKKNS